VAANGSVPGWITLGFLSGLVFAYVFMKTGPVPDLVKSVPDQPSRAPVTGTGSRQIPNLPLDASTLGEVEVLFQAWGGYAVWKNNITQFALWNKDTDAHSDFYEVRRANRIYYFRTLPEKDWPLIDHGEMVRCPLWFAETPEMREEFYRGHPEMTPTTPILRTLPPRSPLLPPLSPMPEEPGSTPLLEPGRKAQTPDGR
jgi:hypothetical protein